MQVCIVGGGLQGLEASYLSRKLGWRTILIDKRENPPAKNLADEFYNFNILNICEDNAREKIKEVIMNSDVILPATENVKALIKLKSLSERYDIPFLQDNEAFFISRNKKETEKLFKKLKIPHPKSFDVNCENFDFPLILKPSSESGSKDVMLVKDEFQLKEALRNLSSYYGEDILIQEYISGLALSLEVIGNGECYFPILTTCLEFDSKFSCKRVYTPKSIDDFVESKYIRSSIKIASALRLRGLMDTQAIVDEYNTPLMIEINARLPSQTPTVVYNSTDINFLDLLYKIFVFGKIPEIKVTKRRHVLYQHIEIKNDTLFIKGERILKNAKKLKLKSNFFGADEAITNIDSNEEFQEGVATIIVKSDSFVGTQNKMCKVLSKITENFDLKKIVDESPTGGMEYDTSIPRGY